MVYHCKKQYEKQRYRYGEQLTALPQSKILYDPAMVFFRHQEFLRSQAIAEYIFSRFIIPAGLLQFQ